jgi:hypothetical protein
MKLTADTRNSATKRGHGKQQSQPSTRAHATINVQHPGSTPDVRVSGPVHFGGFGSRLAQASTEKMLPFFQKITEVFLWAFLAQDVLAMWLPRIGTSLRVGRVEYDPQQDPQAKNLPFTQQMKKWVAGNFKGLNWINFNEETKREFATGPGVLMIPAVIYAVARRLFGKSASELSYHHLSEMSNGLAQHLNQSTLANAKQVTLDQYKTEVAKYFSNAFVDPRLQDALLPGGKQTYRQYLDQWAKNWADAVFESPDAKTRTTKLGALSDELKTNMVAFNRKYRMEAYEFLHGAEKIAVDKPLHRAGEAWVAFEKHGAPTQETLSGLTSNLRRFSDFVEAIWKQKSAQFGLQAEMPAGTLSKLIKTAKEKLVSRKLLLAVGTTIVGGLYLMRLAFWAQNHDDYAATRLLKEKPAGGGNAPNAKGPASAVAPQAAAPAFAPAPMARMPQPVQPQFPQYPQMRAVSFAQHLPVNPAFAYQNGQGGQQ